METFVEIVLETGWKHLGDEIQVINFVKLSNKDNRKFSLLLQLRFWIRDRGNREDSLIRMPL